MPVFSCYFFGSRNVHDVFINAEFVRYGRIRSECVGVTVFYYCFYPGRYFTRCFRGGNADGFQSFWRVVYVRPERASDVQLTGPAAEPGKAENRS